MESRRGSSSRVLPEAAAVSVTGRDSFLHFARPDIDEREIDAVVETMRSGWLTTGPRTRELETAFAARIGARHAVAVNSCTAALHLALESVGVEPGDFVITTPYTFAASAEVIRYFGAVPVFVDVEPDSLNIDPQRVAEAIERLRTDPGALMPVRRDPRMGDRPGRLRAILPVHIAGLPADLDALGAIARREGLALVHDAAHAFPSAYRGRSIGAPGSWSGDDLPEATCFSFYATKTLTTGEGGMLLTEDEGLADRCRIMSLHGISKDAWKRYTAAGSWAYEVIAPGFKYNMGDLAAAIGLVQLDKAEQMSRRRHAIARRYHDGFSKIDELQTPHDREDCEHAWHLYMLRIHAERLTIDRAAFIERLRERKIGASVHFQPLHTQPYYREMFGDDAHRLPVATRESAREISLPIYSGMSDTDVDDVIEAVDAIVRAHRS